ncbi:hypothetical protein LX32DRAFT_663656 [Colletotrichum zoysiae]|uniref:Uncharacterized protein n=1 Tax=Colletotrichum zoysiae TaxID=1216348 RepID=A0AAD9M136_9PEZI|nr:hypothetical protein LX32DRAFT_663656 [Colletotrichum zoysiae]
MAPGGVLLEMRLIPSRKCLHIRLSPPGTPGENRWWVCGIRGKESKDCKCLRPVLYKIQLAKLHDPGRRRSIRAPSGLQAFWTHMQWHPAYLAAVHKALSQDATRLKDLTLFIPGRQKTAADWEAYTRFLSCPLSAIPLSEFASAAVRNAADLTMDDWNIA